MVRLDRFVGLITDRFVRNRTRTVSIPHQHSKPKRKRSAIPSTLPSGSSGCTSRADTRVQPQEETMAGKDYRLRWMEDRRAQLERHRIPALDGLADL